MKKHLFSWVLALILMPFVNAGCQNEAKETPTTVVPSANYDVTVSESVLKFADLVGFKYLEKLERAKKGDPNALKDFIGFHATADGMDGINHAVTTLELIPVVGDENFSYACRHLNPKLNTFLIERLTQGQGRTHNEALKKPLKEWAPMTWAAINNIPAQGNSLTGNSSEMKGQAAGAKANEGATLTGSGTPKKEATPANSDSEALPPATSKKRQ